MITRIVKMTFETEKVEAFEVLFNASKDKIRAFPGVHKLELYRDKHETNIFFTYSVWQHERDLQKYRRSELFKEVWSKTRILFKSRAEAWSLDQLVSL